MTAKTLQCTRIERYIIAWFFILLFFAVGFYIYLVNQTVQNVVQRKSLEEDIVALRTDVGGLETRYISLKNAITLEHAHALGFIESPKTLFVSRQPNPPSLTFNTPSQSDPLTEIERLSLPDAN